MHVELATHFLAHYFTIRRPGRPSDLTLPFAQTEALPSITRIGVAGTSTTNAGAHAGHDLNIGDLRRHVGPPNHRSPVCGAMPNASAYTAIVKKKAVPMASPP